MQMEMLPTKLKARSLTVHQFARNKGDSEEESTSFSIRDIQKPEDYGQEMYIWKTWEKNELAPSFG